MKNKILLMLAMLPLIAGCAGGAYAQGCDKGDIDQFYVDYKQHYYAETDAMVATGNKKVLIVPLWFNDSETIISDRDTLRDDIRKAYLGTNEETGWRSVRTFYEEESWRQLHLDGFVTDWYEPNKSHNYYDTSGKTSLCIKDAVNWYKTTYNDDCKQFDGNGDGYIDAVIMIYAWKNYANASVATKDNLWAYCFWTNGVANPDNPVPVSFFWASYDFMYGTDAGGYGNTANCILDTHTYIHEMGHILGADDYYDYANVESPAGAFSMQDYNVGGHDPFSRMAYGWTKPYVPTKNCIIDVQPFEKNGDLIVLSPKWENSVFDEYIVLELYSPTGVNEFDCTYKYGRSYPQGPKQYGFRVWHVDARLVYSEGDQFGDAHVTNKIEDGRIYRIATSNTTYGTDKESARGHVSPLSTYVYYKQLKLLRKDGEGKFFDESDLFVAGDKFSMSAYKSQFYKGPKLDTGKNLGWKFEIVSISEQGAQVKVTKA